MTSALILNCSLLLALSLAALQTNAIAAPQSKGLYTAKQAARGGVLYAEHCQSCHGAELDGGVGPALTGMSFAQRWSTATRTVDDLFYIMRTSMPRPDVGSLSMDSYLNLLAYTLSKNGVASGTRRLRADAGTLTEIRLATIDADDEPAKIKRQFFTGAGGLISYAVKGKQHVAAASGKGSFWFGGKGAATVVVFRLQ